jgi:cell division protein FtsL
LLDYSKIYHFNQDNSQTPDNQNQTEPEKKQNAEKKILSKWNALIVLIIASVLMILYVSNVIEVKSLLKETIDLKKQAEMIEDKNQLLLTKINELESPERITKIARDKFGMIKAEQTPINISRK